MYNLRSQCTVLHKEVGWQLFNIMTFCFKLINAERFMFIIFNNYKKMYDNPCYC